MMWSLSACAMLLAVLLQAALTAGSPAGSLPAATSVATLTQAEERPRTTRTIVSSYTQTTTVQKFPQPGGPIAVTILNMMADTTYRTGPITAYPTTCVDTVVQAWTEVDVNVYYDYTQSAYYRYTTTFSPSVFQTLSTWTAKAPTEVPGPR